MTRTALLGHYLVGVAIGTALLEGVRKRWSR